MHKGRRLGATAAGGGPNTNSSSEVYIHRNAKYHFRLNFYTAIPDGQITTDEFEQFGLDRLRVLKAVEDASLRRKTDQEFVQLVQSVLKQCLPLDRHLPSSTDTDSHTRQSQALFQQQRRKDHISHFILRLAFSKTEDQRNWFVRQETALFRIRWLQEDKAEREAFLQSCDVDRSLFAQPVPKDELERYKTELHSLLVTLDSDTSYGPSGGASSGTLYKVPFERVPELVAKRQVLVKNGDAYFPEAQRAVVIWSTFRDHLRDGTEFCARLLPTLDEDDRLLPVLDSIGSQYLGRAATDSYLTRFAGDGSIIQFSHLDIDALIPHFPPCMLNLHGNLKQNAHLKHWGRMQYGLFLKGIGLPMEESLQFWRKSFRTVTDDEFNRKYAYNVRHLYGMEGKRTDYTPYSCLKVILGSQPGPGDHHGCPFRHFDPDPLRRLIVGEYGINDSSSGEVLALARAGHYQVACTRLYESTRASVAKRAGKAKFGASGAAGSATEGQPPEVAESITHPNQYFEMSFTSVHGTPTKAGGSRGSEGAKVDGMGVSRRPSEHEGMHESTTKTENVGTGGVTKSMTGDEVDEFDLPAFDSAAMMDLEW